MEDVLAGRFVRRGSPFFRDTSYGIGRGRKYCDGKAGDIGYVASRGSCHAGRSVLVG